MTQRTRNLTAAFNDQPFTGQGASLYASIGAAVQYRNVRLVGRGRRRARKHWIKGTTGNHDIAADSVLKTARVASVTYNTAEITFALPASFASQTAIFDVRHYKDDVENEVSNYRTASVELDSSRDPVTAIHGTAELLSQEPRAGGIVRLRFLFKPALDGVQPTQFVATRTAGPSSPADATVAYSPLSGGRVIEIDTPALSDASAYTYTIRAENGATTKNLLTGISVTADASGPPAPISGSTSTK